MPGVYDYAAINRVQQANDIIDVISEHVSLKKKGRESVGLCPFHEDHRPSMYVNPDKQIFKCFACGAGGDVLKFVQMREGLTFPQAIERLAERAGIQLQPVRRAAPAAPGQEDAIDIRVLARINAWACEFFQRSLADPEQGKRAREYIAERRISSESVAKWRLGVAPNAVDAMVKAAAAQKASIPLLQKAGFMAGARQDKFVNRLMFPIADATGRVIAFGGRTLNDTGAKYINSPTTPLFDKSHTLYGLDQARHQMVATGTAVLVEGYTDVIMAHQFGCANVVATLGTSFTPGHGRIIRRYAKRVVLVFDNDTAGMAAANRALEVCLSQHLDIKLAFVPRGKDPCEFLLLAGKEEFDRMVDEATDVLQFKWRRLSETFAADETLANRKAAVEEFLQVIAAGLAANTLAPVDSGVFVSKLARIIGLDPKEINHELNRRRQRMTGPVRHQEQQSDSREAVWGQGLGAAAQREILEVLLSEPALYSDFENDLTEDLFDVPMLRQVAVVLLRVIRSDGEFSLGAVLAHTESVELAKCLVGLQQVGEQKGNYAARLTDALEVLRRCRAADVRTSAIVGRDCPQTSEGYSDRQNPHSIGMF